MSFDPSILLAQPDKGDDFLWATVTSVDPLLIRFDTETEPMTISPVSLVNGLGVGARVWCQIRNRRVVIVGTPPSYVTYGARIYQEAATNTHAVNAETDIWNMTGIQRNDNMILSGTSGIAAPIDGWYLISGQVQIPSPGDMDRAGSTLHVVEAGSPSGLLNNQIASNTQPFAAGIGSTHFWVTSVPYYMTAGQIARLGFYVGPGSTAGNRVTSGTNTTWLSVLRVGG